MLNFFNFKGAKFEAGQEVEVQGKGHAVVVADLGKGLFHVRYDSGQEDTQVHVKTMKPVKKEDVAVAESSVRSSPSQRSSIFGGFSMKSAPSIKGNKMASPEEPIAELESTKLALSGKVGKRRGSGEVPRKDSKASLNSFISPRSNSSLGLGNDGMSSNTSLAPSDTEVKVKKKKHVRTRILTDVEVRVIERIRKCHEKMNGNVFKSSLDLSLLQLKFIPTNCHELYYIRELIVRKNDFSNVYEAIYPFPNLTKLDISYNKLLPDETEETTSSNTQITNPTATELSPFSAFQTIPLKLISLDISGNNMKTFPEELRILSKSLEILIIRKNQLTEFPSWFGEFKFLQKLDCADNCLTMTKALSHLIEVELPKLSDLNLDRNPCMKIIEEDEKNGEAPSDDALVGNKMRFLIQKRGLFQSKPNRKACINRALDIKSRLISIEKNKILADVMDNIDMM